MKNIKYCFLLCCVLFSRLSTSKQVDSDLFPLEKVTLQVKQYSKLISCPRFDYQTQRVSTTAQRHDFFITRWSGSDCSGGNSISAVPPYLTASFITGIREDKVIINTHYQFPYLGMVTIDDISFDGKYLILEGISDIWNGDSMHINDGYLQTRKVFLTLYRDHAEVDAAYPPIEVPDYIINRNCWRCNTLQ
ncbi:hypothetical protein [Photobacterium leiognathi]|uniref:hypothetical protein n=1 Tax=Photobacterium leiognathi TaxID=553611 RepID=UPI002981065C|nr:hypothetical protein [Photobacterium leiognathi]